MNFVYWITWIFIAIHYISVQSLRIFFSGNYLNAIQSSIKDIVNNPLHAQVTKSEEKVLTALEVYKSFYHHVNVAQFFEVPANSLWPRSLWGFQLGSKVNHIRHRFHNSRIKPSLSSPFLTKLNEMNFVWSAKENRLQELVESVSTYKARYGHTRIPSNYVVQNIDFEGYNSSFISMIAWPSGLIGYKLGDKWRRLILRMTSIESNDVQMLVDSKLIRPQKYEKYDILTPTGLSLPQAFNANIMDLLLGALNEYRIRYGSREIPNDLYVNEFGQIATRCLLPNMTYSEISNVSNTAYKLVSILCPWPKQYHKFKVGKTLQSICSHSFSKNVPVWIKLGHCNVIKPLTKRQYDRFLFDMYAISTYKEKFANTRIPLKYVIPDDADEWPIELHHFHLGHKVKQLRSLKIYNTTDHHNMLKTIGFEFDKTNRDLNFEIIITALKHHLKLFGDVKVPRYFVIPEKDQSWPSETWGLKLGVRLHGIKSKKSYNNESCHHRLRAIGLDI
jgi:hypothetical protein